MVEMICDVIQAAAALLVGFSAIFGIISWVWDRREREEHRRLESDAMRLYGEIKRAVEARGGNVAVSIDPINSPYAYKLAEMLVEKGLLQKVGGDSFMPAFFMTLGERSA